MRKIIFTLMLMLSTIVMADDNPVVIENLDDVKSEFAFNQADIYNFNINYRRLGCCLGMTLDQMETFEVFFDQFKDKMMFAYNECDGDERTHVVEDAINKNIKTMKHIFNKEQYKKYILLFNTTLKNNGLIK